MMGVCELIRPDMLCAKPVTVSTDAKLKRQVRCGVCMPCRIRRRDEWACRILMEGKLHAQSSFFTLTYDRNSLPEDGSLKKKDLQDFLKRLRHYYPTGSIRYFISGEYGPNTNRPHYHGILFGLSPLVLEPSLGKAWKSGFTTISSLSPQRARYVAKYTMKPAPSYLTPGTARTPEFSVMSQNPAIGDKAIPSVGDALKRLVSSGIIRMSRGGELRLPGLVRIEGRCFPLDRRMRGKLRLHLDLPEVVNSKGLSVVFDGNSKLQMEFGDPLERERLAARSKGEEVLRRGLLRQELR